MQIPPQLTCPMTQQMPLEQTWPMLQAAPEPQRQVPPVQLSANPGVQAWPQLPQLCRSVLMLVSHPLAEFPSQSANPDWQVT